nr:MAG TPA: hypothetical protein [Caudoviricetes sp.]
MKVAETKENTYPGIGWEEVYRTNGIFYSHFVNRLLRNKRSGTYKIISSKAATGEVLDCQTSGEGGLPLKLKEGKEICDDRAYNPNKYYGSPIMTVRKIAALERRELALEAAEVDFERRAEARAFEILQEMLI